MHSGHGAQYDPEAIREVERILKENLTDKELIANETGSVVRKLPDKDDKDRN